MKVIEIHEQSKKLNKQIIFIISPMLGMVGQATIAFHLQNALSNKYYPVVIGYCSPKIQKTKFNGIVIELPWGSEIKAIRILFYFFRILIVSIYGLVLRPKIIIAQGDTGIILGILIKKLVKDCKCIGSFHESLFKYNRSDLKSKIKGKLLNELDSTHFVSNGIKEQYEKIYNVKNPFTIYSPA